MTWKRLLRGLLPELLQRLKCTIDANNNNITFNHICGKGDWTKAQKQARDILCSVLERVKAAAEKAFYIMPTKYPGQSYINVKQAPAEPFLHFIDRLREIVDQ